MQKKLCRILICIQSKSIFKDLNLWLILFRPTMWHDYQCGVDEYDPLSKAICKFMHLRSVSFGWNSSIEWTWKNSSPFRFQEEKRIIVSMLAIYLFLIVLSIFCLFDLSKQCFFYLFVIWTTQSFLFFIWLLCFCFVLKTFLFDFFLLVRIWRLN